MNRQLLSLFMIGVVLCSTGVIVLAQAPANALEAILLAHGAGLVPPPISVQMTGTVDRGGNVEPFRLLATRDEELRIEYGSSGRDTRVASPKITFRSEGEKVTYPSGTTGFAQLDVTGLFFIQQLRNRAVRVELTDDWTLIAGVRARRIHVTSESSKATRGVPRVDDRADLYVTEAGLLGGISRSFYEGRPERYTETFTFTDYRTTEGVLLPYRIEVYLNSKKRQTFQIEAYRFDTPTDRELFLPGRTR